MITITMNEGKTTKKEGETTNEGENTYARVWDSTITVNNFYLYNKKNWDIGSPLYAGYDAAHLHDRTIELPS